MARVASPSHSEDLLSPDFVRNDGNVTSISAPDEDPQPEADQDVARGGGDGSDSGVELNGQDRTEPENTPLDTPTRDHQHLLLDYDGNSEGGSESSASVLSRPGPSPSPGPCTTSTPRRKASAGSSRCSAPSSPAAAVTPTARARERSVGGRGASCTRADRAGRESNACRTPQRGSSLARTPRPTNLMTSSMTSSIIGSLCGGGRGGSVSVPAARGTSSTPRTPRGSAVAAVCRDDGRWPSTVQRAASLSRARTGAGAGAALSTLTSSSSKNSVNSNTASTPSPTVESKSEKFATLPRRRRRRSVESPGIERSPATRKLKIRLYHEIGAQTALTSQDIEDALEGRACRFRPIDAADQIHQEVQVDLQEIIQTQMLDKRLKMILSMLGFEQPSVLQSRSVGNTMSQQKHSDRTAVMESLDLLEEKALLIQKHDRQQRNAISQLRNKLSRMENLHKESEAESAELHEFELEEKEVLAESLKDAEEKIQEQKKTVDCLQKEVERLREECQHMVRESEQRRQEILTLEARVAGQELRSREALLHQGGAVSGAAVALCALSSRLDSLASKLEDAPVDDALLALTAESEAVLTRTKEACRPLSVHLENSYQTLDNVTEPVLEDDGGLRDSVHVDTNTSRLLNSESIQNLSTAILNRCLQEEANDNHSTLSEDASVHLVDQVLDVDTSVTRLLRAILQSFIKNDPSAVNSTGSSHNVHQEINASKQSFNQNEDEPQTFTSLLKSNDELCNKEGNNSVSSGIIELAYPPERVTGAS